MRWFIIFACLIASSAGFKYQRRSPCHRVKFGFFCDPSYNAHSVNHVAAGPHYNPHSPQTDINQSRLIQIVNNNHNNIQTQQHSASMQHQAGLQPAYVAEPAYNTYPVMGHKGPHYGNSASVASSSAVASSAVASAGATSWNQQQHGGNLVYPYGHVPAGGVAQSSSSSWSSSSSGYDLE